MPTNKDMADKFKELFKKRGYRWEPFNLIGIRHEENQGQDVFNDKIGYVTDTDFFFLKGTTDPGAEATEKKEGGAAHLCLGNHPKIWTIGIHAKGTPFAHEAFIQIGNSVKIWRDIDKDTEFDENEPVQQGYFGINFHRAALNKIEKIGPYSYGCQVAQIASDFNEILVAAKASKMKYFSYTLFDKSEIDV
jgi:hypothetical protein